MQRRWLGVSLTALLAVLGVAIGSARANAPAYQYTVNAQGVLDNKTGLTWQQTPPNMTFTFTAAKAYCLGLGTGWRLPTIKELQSLVDYSQIEAPRIDKTVFPNTPSSHHWSSTPSVGSVSWSWFVCFCNGSTDVESENMMNYLRCVR